MRRDLRLHFLRDRRFGLAPLLDEAGVARRMLVDTRMLLRKFVTPLVIQALDECVGHRLPRASRNLDLASLSAARKRVRSGGKRSQFQHRDTIAGRLVRLRLHLWKMSDLRPVTVRQGVVPVDRHNNLLRKFRRIPELIHADHRKRLSLGRILPAKKFLSLIHVFVIPFVQYSCIRNPGRPMRESRRDAPILYHIIFLSEKPL